IFPAAARARRRPAACTTPALLRGSRGPLPGTASLGGPRPDTSPGAGPSRPWPLPPPVASRGHTGAPSPASDIATPPPPPPPPPPKRRGDPPPAVPATPRPERPAVPAPPPLRPAPRLRRGGRESSQRPRSRRRPPPPPVSIARRTPPTVAAGCALSP